MKIPTYTREQDIQGGAMPQVSVGSAGIEGEAMSRFGEAGVNLAATGIAIERQEERLLAAAAKKRQDDQDRREANQLLYDAEDIKRNMMSDEAKRLDGNEDNGSEAYGNVHKSLTDINQMILGKAKNQNVADLFNLHVPAHDNQHRNSFATHVAAVDAAKQVGRATAVIDSTTQAVNFGNVDTMLKIMKQDIQMLDLPAAKRDEKLREGQYKVMDSIIRQTLDNPTFATAFLASKDMQDKWIGLASPDLKNDYLKLIETAKSKGVEITKYAEILGSSMRPDGSVDYDAAIAKALTPTKELTPEQGRSIALSIDGLKKVANQADEELAATQGLSLMDAYAKKSLTYDTVTRSLSGIRNPIIKERETKQWVQYLDHAANTAKTDAREARAEGRYERQLRLQEKDAKSKSILGEVISDHFNEVNIDTGYLLKKMEQGLDPTIAFAYGEKVMKEQEVIKQYKTGADVIDKQFKLGVIDAPTRGRMLEDYKAYVKEKKPTPKEAIDWAENLTKPQKTNKFGEILDNIWKATTADHMGNLGATLMQGGKAPRETASPDQDSLEFTAKKYGITVEEVKRRLEMKNAR